MVENYSVDQRLADLRDAFLSIGDLLTDKKDMHLVHPERLESLIRILTDELERARVQAEDELAALLYEERQAAAKNQAEKSAA